MVMLKFTRKTSIPANYKRNAKIKVKLSQKWYLTSKFKPKFDQNKIEFLEKYNGVKATQNKKFKK